VVDEEENFVLSSWEYAIAHFFGDVQTLCVVHVILWFWADGLENAFVVFGWGEITFFEYSSDGITSNTFYVISGHVIRKGHSRSVGQ
jgi:hypothetical protein